MATGPTTPLSHIDLQTLTSLFSQFNQMQQNSNRANLSPILDPTSHYYLHPGESPGTPLIASILNLNNYHTWETSMSRALRGKNKIKCIDGSLPKPPSDDPLFEAWERCNMYVGDIFCITAKQEDMSITDYFTKMKGIWEGLDNFKPVPSCESCHETCKCGLGIMRGYRQDTRMVRFLRGLSDQFTTVR
ncbi:uncharacterized protein [Arachis hypogaea]|uniref:uncharacterized protein n=1 Tax=Arachis hypogaea TaxID=3818 RepID=UPI003B215C44